MQETTKKAEKKFWTPQGVRHTVFSDQISLSTLMALIHRKEIPSIRLGVRFYIPYGWVNQQLKFAEQESPQ